LSNKNLFDSVYKEAWQILYNCLGERMQDEELELMDAMLSGVKLDLMEEQDAMANMAKRD